MESFRPHKFISDPTPLFKQQLRNSQAVSNPFSAGERQGNSPTTYQLAGLAKRLTESRARRKEFMAPSLFGEPGWDMLLALLNAESGGYRMTVSSLCVASDAPPTTALRWLAILGELDLVRRFQSPLDARVIFIQLQPSARLALGAYLTDIWSTLFAADEILPDNLNRENASAPRRSRSGR